MNDLSAFDEEPTAAPATLQELVTHATELADLERQIADLEALQKSLNGRANELKTKIIPDKMAEIGVSEFTLDDGSRVKVEGFVSGTLPKDGRREKALEEIVAWGAAGVIKTEMVLTFEKSQHNEALSLAAELREKGYDPVVNSGIHPQTYLATIRERLESGDPVDLDLMGVFSGRKTKIIPAKVKKPRKS